MSGIDTGMTGLGRGDSFFVGGDDEASRIDVQYSEIDEQDDVPQTTDIPPNYGEKICQTLKKVSSYALDHKLELLGSALAVLGGTIVSGLVNLPGTDKQDDLYISVGLGLAGLGMCMWKTCTRTTETAAQEDIALI